MIPLAYVCKRYRLPDEIVLTIMAFVEPIDMAHELFPEPGQKRWFSEEDQDQSK